MRIRLAKPEEIPAKVQEKLETLYNHLWEIRTTILEKDHARNVKYIEQYVGEKIKWPPNMYYDVEYDTVYGYQVKVYKKA